MPLKKICHQMQGIRFIVRNQDAGARLVEARPQHVKRVLPIVLHPCGFLPYLAGAPEGSALRHCSPFELKALLLMFLDIIMA
jgi:hypothetical protein